MHTGKSLILAAIAIFSGGNMFADQMSYSYTTSGQITGAHPELGFTAQLGAVSGTTVAGAASNLPLGVFSLDKAIDVDTYTDVNFTLDVTFISPTGIVGGGTWGFDALLNGTITKQGNGSLNLEFNPGSKDFTFQNASSGGFFTFSVANLGDMRWNQFSGDGSHQGDYELVGSISGAVDPPVAPTGAVPEPGSVWLAATAICGTAIGLRRKVRS
jgi:hypothetical protein